jgi:hypothetical protein
VTVTPGDSTDNIVEVLMTQHRRIEQLINGLQDADPGSRPRLFGELTHALGIHESVEHVVVHPRVRQGVDGAADLIEKLMSDELSINDALVELGDVAPDTDEFHRHLTDLRDLVLEHNRHEENDEFPLLTEHFDTAEHRRLARASEALSKLAVTGSQQEYDHADLAPGSPNMMVGPFAAVLDRARQFLDTPSQD